MRSMRRARELDPFYAMHHALSTLVAYHAGDYTSAIEFGRQAIVTDPEFWIGYFQIAQVYEHVRKTDLALEAISNAAKLGGGNSKTLALRGHILAKNGRADEAREQIATLETMARDRYVPPYATALILAGLDDREAALDWLDRAFDARDVHLVFLPIDPKWDPYRKHPRFAALLDRCNFHGK
jgi:tetratricopeptide (TPR) repeat protein